MAATPGYVGTLNNQNDRDCDNEKSSSSTSSHFKKTVSLHDWWLIKGGQEVQGKWLAVAGVTCPDNFRQKAIRVFHSAPITKRYDDFTLETADGITIVIKGFINKTRTTENGFSSQVFDHFFFGFPSQWQEYATTTFLGAAVNPSIDSQKASDFDGSTTEPVSAVTGTKDSSPFLRSRKNKSTSEDKYNIKEKPLNAGNSMKNSVVVVEGPPIYDLVPASEKIEISVGRKKRKRRSFGKSKDKKRAPIKRISINNDASAEATVDTDSHSSGEYSPHAGSDEENLDTNNFGKMLSIRTSGAALTVSSNELKISEKNEKENEENKGELKGGSSFSMPALLEGPQTILRCARDDTTQGQSLCRSTTVEDSDILSKYANDLVGTLVFSRVQLGAEANIIASTMVETDKVNPDLSNSGQRKINTSLRNLKNIQKQKSVPERVGNYKAKEFISNERKLERNSGRNLPPLDKVDVSEAMLRTSRTLKILSGNSKGKEKEGKIAAERGGSSRKQARRKIIFDADVNPCTPKRKGVTCIRSPKAMSLKRSRSGRLLLPILEFWRNQLPVYDQNRNITGIQGVPDAVEPSKGSKYKSQKKQRST